MTPSHSNIVLKVQQGTVKGSGSLCRSCRQAHITRGTRNEQVILCNSQAPPDNRIRFDVAECNRYLSAAQPTLYEMEEIAWRLITKGAGRQIGFVNAQEFRDKYAEGGPNRTPPPPRD